MDRIKLTATEGHKLHRKGTDLYTDSIILGDWDSAENYELVADADVPSEEEGEPLTAEDMLNELNNIING